MIRTTALALCTLAATTANAQTATDPIDPNIFIGAPLMTNEEKYEYTKGPEFQFQPTGMLVIGPSAVKPTAEWTDADTAACSARDGEVIALPAGRTTCFVF